MYAFGELFTLPVIYNSAPSYTGPVDIILGQFDYLSCPRDFSIPVDKAKSFRASFYSAAESRSSTYVVPDSEHAVNAHNNTKKAFNQILSFFRTHSFQKTYSVPDKQHVKEAAADGSFEMVLLHFR